MHMTSRDDLDRVAARIAVLQGAYYDIPYPQEVTLTPDSRVFPDFTLQAMAGEDTCYPSWDNLNPQQQSGVLERFVDWHYFNTLDIDSTVKNVVEGREMAKWFEGVELYDDLGQRWEQDHRDAPLREPVRGCLDYEAEPLPLAAEPLSPSLMEMDEPDVPF